MPLPDEEAFYKELADRIRTERNRLSITLDLMGKHLDLKKSTMHNLEKGKHRPSIYQLIQIAELFQMDYQKLIPYQYKESKKKIKLEEMVTDQAIDPSAMNKISGFLSTINKK